MGCSFLELSLKISYLGMLFLVFIKLKEVFYIHIMDKKLNTILDF